MQQEIVRESEVFANRSGCRLTRLGGVTFVEVRGLVPMVDDAGVATILFAGCAIAHRDPELAGHPGARDVIQTVDGLAVGAGGGAHLGQ